MNLPRTGVIVCILVVMLRDNSVVGEQGQEMTAFTGDSVVLPCTCSEKVEKLVWQIGENKVVNLYNTEGSPHESYKNRTQLFLPNKKRNCSLLLQRVSWSDHETFTCHAFGPNEDLQHTCNIKLNVQATTHSTPSNTNDPFTSTMEVSGPKEPEKYTAVSIGVPFSLVVLVILLIGTALLIRCHRQKPRTMVVVLETESGQPIMNPSPV